MLNTVILILAWIGALGGFAVSLKDIREHHKNHTSAALWVWLALIVSVCSLLAIPIQQIRDYQDTQKAKNKIVFLTASLRIQISGDWSESVEPFSSDVVTIYPKDTKYLDITWSKNGRTVVSNMYGADLRHVFRSTGVGAASFSVNVMSLVDDPLLGEQSEMLRNAFLIYVELPLVFHQRMAGKNIQVDEVEIEFKLSEEKKIIFSRKFQGGYKFAPSAWLPINLHNPGEFMK